MNLLLPFGPVVGMVYGASLDILTFIIAHWHFSSALPYAILTGYLWPYAL